MKLKDSVAVITGGGSGIGQAIALRLASEQCKIVLADRDAQALEETLQMVRAKGGEGVTVVVDVTSETDIQTMVEVAIASFGKINIVVPCAGIIRDSLMLSVDQETKKVKRKMSLEDFRKVVDINLVGSFLTLRDCASAMVDLGCEGVLFTISSVQKVGGVGQINYSSTKAALAMWPKLLVGEFHMKGIEHIRVVGIAPGYVGTNMVKNMNQKALNSIVSSTHLQRLVEPDEIARTIQHVVENDAIDATTIEVTAGVISGMIAK